MDIKKLIDKLTSSDPLVPLTRQEKDLLLRLLRKGVLTEDRLKNSIQVSSGHCPCCGKE